MGARPGIIHHLPFARCRVPEPWPCPPAQPFQTEPGRRPIKRAGGHLARAPAIAMGGPRDTKPSHTRTSLQALIFDGQRIL
jgi:hypothetical protein